MTRVDEFDSFYRATAANTVTVTYALSGDRDATRDAVISAYRHAWSSWSKIRLRRPLDFVRATAASMVGFEERTHPIRHRHQSVEDPELFAALDLLPYDSRLLLVLMTLGNADLERASREAGVGVEDGIERATSALAILERSLELDLGAVEERITALAAVKLGVRMPAAVIIRETAARGQRRGTIAAIAAAVVLIALGGAVTTTGSMFTRMTDVPDRQRLGAETADRILDAATISADDLLTTNAAGALDATSNWKTLSTDDDPTSQTPYATCPTTRYATKRPLRVFVRTMEGSKGHARIAQAIEVAQSNAGAATASKVVVSWYANCQHPRVQLLRTYTGDHMTILQLTSHRDPVRTFTVGVRQTGNVVTTLVHETDGMQGPSAQAFATSLAGAANQLCSKSGGDCGATATIRPAEPPRASEAPAFLAVVDLPPIANVDHVWAGVDARSDPAITLCKERSAASTAHPGSRLYVIPEAGLPEAFGVAETVATFASEEAAAEYLGQVSSTMSRCERHNLSASVSKAQGFRTKSYRGLMWHLHFELNKRTSISYRTAVIQRGNTVAKVTFTPAGDLDMSTATFLALSKRAAERLLYAD